MLVWFTLSEGYSIPDSLQGIIRFPGNWIPDSLKGIFRFPCPPSIASSSTYVVPVVWSPVYILVGSFMFPSICPSVRM